LSDTNRIASSKIKAVDLLTINEENRLKIKVEELTERRDEIQLMKESHEQEMKAMRDEMENKFQQILSKIDVTRLK
jgi:chromosome segregation ATPase